MRFGVLGPLAVWTDDGRAVTVPDLKVRALLAALLVDVGRVVPADRLVDDLWGSRLPRNPLGTLQARVSQLRRALGAPELVVHRAPGYLLDVPASAVDVGRFRALVSAGRAGEGLALWRGPALADFADAGFAQAFVARLEEERLAAIEQHATIHPDLGELGALVAAHPLRERLRAVHMRALYRAGRQAEALASFQDLRVRLADELGADPSPDLSSLHEAMLRQDPALSASRPAGNVPAALSPLIGRSTAVTEVGALLATARLVTLTGPGGVGKTSLALEVARRTGEAAWLVELASLPTRLPATHDTSHHLPTNHTTAAHLPTTHAPSDPLPTNHAPSDRLPTHHAPGDRATPGHALPNHTPSGHTSGHATSGRVASAHVASAHVASAHVASAHVASGRVAEAVAAVLGLRDDLDGPGPQPSGNSRTSGTSRVSADGQASGGLREAADAQALAGRVAGALRGRGALLVLDNCEHVIDEAADFVGMLLAAAPDARVLATSREPLRLTGEHLWPVPPLTLPSEPRERDGFHQAATTNPRAAGDATPSGPDGARPTSSAVELFVTRVQASAPGIALDDEAVAVICRRLDGIPLALELAATRVRALGVREVAARLDDRFRMLGAGARDAPARQRTLWSVIDWSWELLDEEERLVLRRLAVHADGCTLEAASAVSGFDAAGPLAQLVDRSLVTVVHNADAPRYRLLESVAAYCMEHVTPDDRLRERHRAYYVDLAERAERELRGPDQRRWLARLDAESPNLRLALDGAPADLALRLVAALSWYWFLRGRLSEARRSLAIALNTPHEGQTTTRGSGSDDQPTHTAAAARPAGTTTRGEPTSPHEDAAKGSAQRETATAPGDQPHHEGALAPDEVAVPDGVARHRRAATSEEGATREGAASLSERPTADEEQAAGDAVGAGHDTADAVSATRDAGDAAGARHEAGEAVSLAGGTGGAGLRVGVLGWLAGIRGALGEVVDEAVGDPRGEWFLAHVRWAYGDFAVHEERVDAVLQSTDDPWTIAAALSTRARLVMARGDLAAARRDAERALGMFRELGDAWGQVEAAEGLSALAEITGDYERAESLRTDALRLAEELGLWTKVSFTLANLGRVAMLRGDYPRAEELHHRAAKLAAEQSYRSGQEFAEVGLGLLARRQGRLDEAEHRLRAWLGWLGEVKGAAGTAFILAELGFVAEQRGDAEAALALQLEGHAQAEATGSPRAIALALEGLAGAYSLAAHHLATTTNPVHPRITSPHGQKASEAAEHPQEVTAPQAEASHPESSEALGAVDGAQGVAGPGEKAAREHQAPRRKGRETVDAPQRKGRQAVDAPQREVAALRGKAVELLEQATHLRTSVGTPLAYGERGDVARILARLETIRDV